MAVAHAALDVTAGRSSRMQQQLQCMVGRYSSGYGMWSSGAAIAEPCSMTDSHACMLVLVVVVAQWQGRTAVLLQTSHPAAFSVQVAYEQPQTRCRLCLGSQLSVLCADLPSHLEAS